MDLLDRLTDNTFDGADLLATIVLLGIAIGGFTYAWLHWDDEKPEPFVSVVTLTPAQREVVRDVLATAKPVQITAKLTLDADGFFRQAQSLHDTIERAFGPHPYDWEAVGAPETS